MCQHNQRKVNETKKRSLVKSISFHIVQIIIDIPIIYSMILYGLPPEVIAITGAILVECVCFAGYFFWERLWNRIDWGRIVIAK